MSGIPVYTQSPINAPAKPSGVTPQTAAPQVEASPVAPAYVPATTTSTTASSYPPAGPGAAAFPAPTGTAAQRYAPLQPTKTTSSEAARPPPPQPGAAPIPSSGSRETFRPEPTSAPQPPTSMPLPSQMSIPPPSSAFGGQPPTSSTATANTPSSSYPVQIPLTESGGPRRSLEHPPGYHQNVYASDQTSEQRRAQETINASSATSGRESSENVGAMGSESIWNTAKKWTQQAGEKISEAEAEVWRKINKD
ncbi:hypothetical protein LOCC1_G002565 [Lachnellula occidentalis]|uniref:Uncharacterized protein n=1 Tax=Lachnellula occidentalis TaxID=215460 RepID=A0A8H8S5X1_9HELO|nr:hypothetical protein LOCC1_G002565 [Lachnellula occidentalis]